MSKYSFNFNNMIRLDKKLEMIVLEDSQYGDKD